MRSSLQGWSHYVHCADQLLAKTERACDTGSGSLRPRKVKVGAVSVMAASMLTRARVLRVRRQAVGCSAPCLQGRVALERACCALLLGHESDARALLGLSPSSPFPPDADVETFVLVRSCMHVPARAINSFLERPDYTKA